MTKHEYKDKSLGHTVSKKIANVVIKNTQKNHRETRNHE